MLKTHTRIGSGLIALIVGCCFANGESVTDKAVVGDEGEMAGTQPLDLGQAIEIAKANSPRLWAALAEVEVAEGERIEVGLWENPELEVYSEEIPVDSGGFSGAKNMVGLSQTVPFPGKKSLERKAADLGIEQFRNEFDATELEIVRDVRIAFYRVLATQRNMEIFEELSALSRSLAETAEKRLNAGEAPAQELLRAEIEWQRARTKTERSRGELSEAKQTLATILGRPELRDASLSGELSSGNDDKRSLRAPHDALQHHPRMKQAYLAIQEADTVYDRSRKEPLPDLTFEVAFGSRDSDLEGSENLAEVAVSLPLPLIDRGQGTKRTSKGKLAAAQAQLAATEQELLEQFESAVTRMRTVTTRVKNYHDEILPKTDKALSLMQRGFKEGKFTFIDLLDTQRTVAETRLDYQEALFELNAAEAKLDSLLAHDNLKEERE